MSIDTLKSDLKESLATVKRLDPALTSAADLVRLMKDTVFPTFEAIVEEMEEMDGSIAEAADIAAGMGDQLTEDTGALFAELLTNGLALAALVEKHHPEAKDAVEKFRELAKEAAETLEEIVVPDPDDDDDAEDDKEDAGDH